ncbi:MAG: hypothetical protein RIA63_04405, partial [Cyclobacteriaceae bacterium]
MRNHLLLLLLGVVISRLSAQDIPVNMYTGTPSIYIPLAAISDHDLSESVGISYNASGVKLVESRGKVGIGWNLHAGGSVTRVVRGLPDDFAGTGSDTRVGWLLGGYADDMENTSDIAGTTADTNCSDETTVNAQLSGYDYKVDTEPDIYYYQAGEASGSFVFDNDLNIRLIPYQDIKIEYTTSSGTITAFTITTNNGVKYFFDVPVPVTHYALKASGITDVQFQKRAFEQYDSASYGSPVVYNSEWKLSKKTSPLGAQITYQYWTDDFTSSEDVKVGIRNTNSSDIVEKVVYYMITAGDKYYLSTISSQAGGQILMYGGETLTSIAVHDQRKSYTPVKTISFNYQKFGTLTPDIDRWFLKSVQETSGCDVMPPYVFTYIGVDYANGTCNLPDIYSNSRDFWGYYNGKSNTSPYPKLYVYPSESLSEQIRIWSNPNHTGAEYVLPGADRNADASKAQIGSLETIRFPSGGSTSFNYEPNDFYDPVAGQTFIGGGLRIKSLTYFDGINPESTVRKNYTYKDGSNVSSGRLINRPVFHIPTYEYRDPESSGTKSYGSLASNPQSMYEHLLVRSDEDLAQNYYDQAVGYLRGVTSISGRGSEEFQYALPALYGDASSGEWNATINKFVRPSACPSMAMVTNGGAWLYPYTLNPNFGHGRGLLTKKIDWNEAGNAKVREITNTY